MVLKLAKWTAALLPSLCLLYSVFSFDSENMIFFSDSVEFLRKQAAAVLGVAT